MQGDSKTYYNKCLLIVLCGIYVLYRRTVWLARIFNVTVSSAEAVYHGVR